MQASPPGRLAPSSLRLLSHTISGGWHASPARASFPINGRPSAWRAACASLCLPRTLPLSSFHQASQGIQAELEQGCPNCASVYWQQTPPAEQRILSFMIGYYIKLQARMSIDGSARSNAKLRYSSIFRSLLRASLWTPSVSCSSGAAAARQTLH